MKKNKKKDKIVDSFDDVMLNQLGDFLNKILTNKTKKMAKSKHTVVTKPKEFLAKTTKAKGVTLAQDKNGFFCYTHRASSKRYKTIGAIPKSVIEFIESTG